MHETPERVLAGLRPFDGVAMRAEPFLEERRDTLLVLDDQDRDRGILIQNVAPLPGRLTTPDSPLWALAIPWTMASPKPMPPLRDDLVLNGSKTARSSPGGSPPPSSATSKRQLEGSARMQRHTGSSPLA